MRKEHQGLTGSPSRQRSCPSNWRPTATGSLVHCHTTSCAAISAFGDRLREGLRLRDGLGEDGRTPELFDVAVSRTPELFDVAGGTPELFDVVNANLFDVVGGAPELFDVEHGNGAPELFDVEDDEDAGTSGRRYRGDLKRGRRRKGDLEHDRERKAA